jgi:hypothetical protein
MDYRSIAVHNDKAMTPTGTQDRRLALGLPNITPAQKIILGKPEGAAIEDKNGVLLAIRLPKVFDHIHVSSLSPLFLPHSNLGPGPHDRGRS